MVCDGDDDEEEVEEEDNDEEEEDFLSWRNTASTHDNPSLSKR
jgi:hypothetical protein